MFFVKGVGYGIVVGFGAFFALVCSLLAWFDVTFIGHRDTSEHFQTASRNIKTGLIAGAPCSVPAESACHIPTIVLLTSHKQ